MTAEEIAEIMLEALNAWGSLWDALPEDHDQGNALIVAALDILSKRPDRICE